MRNRNLAVLPFGLLTFGALLICATSRPQADTAVSSEAKSSSNLRGQMPPSFDQEVARVVAEVDRIGAPLCFRKINSEMVLCAKIIWRVSVLCPQSVQTGMTTPGPSAARVDGVMQPAEVARIVVEAMEAERFLILSHATVHEYMRRKASGIDRWLAGMRRLRDKTYGVQRSG